ncbi:MAG TPA: ATP-binding cassette domain-containing protein [Clostridiales bacterium]|nr:ATP-binding cassette domain-containing protein [Clostridiales bacterium]
MLLMENVSVSYKTKKSIYLVIQNLSLQIDRGEALIILGPSGCGKSTLINTLAGTVSPDTGTIQFVKDGKIQDLNPITHKIGIIPQNCGLLPWKTVRENCLLPLKIRKEQMNEEGKRDIQKIYEALDIADLLDRYPRQLSGGQVQRVAIARSFILRPDLLLMDEPFSSLDAISREDARELFLKIWKQYRPTTILVTHSIEEALHLGSRIIVMGTCKGDIVYEMVNPYFGKSKPDNVEYLITKQLLREKLKTNVEKEEACV